MEEGFLSGGDGNDNQRIFGVKKKRKKSKKENNPTKSTVKTIIGCACRGAVFGPVGALIGGLVGAGIEVLASDHELREKLGDKLGL